MARSLAGGSAAGRYGTPARSRAALPRATSGGRARGARWPLWARLSDAWRGALGALADHRRRLLALLAALVLLIGGWLWLRQSSLVAVEHVRISGVSPQSPDGPAIEAALAQAARGMSTLDVRSAVLRDAVSGYPIVRSLQAHASFPHGLHIEVVEQPPVAALEAGGSRTAVAADGVVLGAGLLSGSLPTVHAGGAQAAILPLTGRSVRSAMLLQELAVLGDAPPPLAALVTRAYAGPLGVTVVLASRVRAYFGDATRPHAKWLSLARVLADPSSSGAAYVDVRVPERPAAGFAPGTAHAAAGSEAEPSSASDPTTAAELAAGLEAAVAGGLDASSGATPSGAETQPAGAGSAEASTPAQGPASGSESTSGAGSERTSPAGSSGPEQGATGG